MLFAMFASWDPAQYLRFGAERARPFLDLMSRVDAEAPAEVVDLGCGPGELTAWLSERWPAALVSGIDSSPEMIDRAGKLAAPGRLEFVRADLRDWTPGRPVDVLVSHATLQWVPDHLELLPRLVAAVAPGGWLAIQVPGNFASPTHTELRALCLSARWRERLQEVAAWWPASAEPIDYLTRLAGLGCAVDVWESTYLHVLTGPDPVVEWMKGTALRPVLAVLDPDELAEFLGTYASAMRAAYPPRQLGPASATVVPYRRIFAVARPSHPSQLAS
jgi:trans-aconitate 2-methyltransferase